MKSGESQTLRKESSREGGGRDRTRSAPGLIAVSVHHEKKQQDHSKLRRAGLALSSESSLSSFTTPSSTPPQILHVSRPIHCVLQ